MDAAVKEEKRCRKGAVLQQSFFPASEVVALKMNGCLLITHDGYFLRLLFKSVGVVVALVYHQSC